MHRHGFYWRFANPSGQDAVRIQRYICPLCSLTLSVLPSCLLPYRGIRVPRLQAFFDSQGKVESGPDPPPDCTEADCLRRAWARFQRRIPVLQEAFGQLIESVTDCASTLWEQIRQAKGSLEDILGWLAQTREISLLGDYTCLKPPAR